MLNHLHLCTWESLAVVTFCGQGSQQAPLYQGNKSFLNLGCLFGSNLGGSVELVTQQYGDRLLAMEEAVMGLITLHNKDPLMDKEPPEDDLLELMTELGK